jgi:plasmid replication initiation protein
MRRADLIAFEKHVAETYRREASNRKAKAPEFAAILITWAEASERRIEALRCGPLFVAEEA